MKAHVKAAETVTISREEYEELKAQNADLNTQVKWLMEQMKLAKSKLYGVSSEQAKAEMMEQLNFLFDEPEVHANMELPEPEITEVVAHTRKKRPKDMKEHLPEDVPTVVVEHGLPEAERICAICGEVMQAIGKEVRETLVVIPAQVQIRQDVYYTYACVNCQKNGTSTPIVKTPKDNPVIAGSFASPEAVAHLMTQKYVMGSPLYRQAAEFKRSGILLTRQTMSNWLLKATDSWLVPIYNELHKQLVAGKRLHADETPLQVLHEPGRKATSKSYMWLYRTSGDTKKAIVLYEYQPTRKAEHPQKFLEGFSGWLHTDGYPGYNGLPEAVHVVGCWAHARRYFEKAVRTAPKSEQYTGAAAVGLAYCTKLFKIEENLADKSPEDRYKQRQEQAKPVLDAFLAWARTVKAAPKSALGKALTYLGNQWPQLVRYLEDGNLEISNNRAERSIKPFVIGRKNFLFANTQNGASGSATMFSMIETAKENGLDPYRYLVYVFKTAPNLDFGNAKNVETLLPWNAPDECHCKEAACETNKH